MNVFGGSQVGDTKRIISDIQSSYKTIQNDVKLLKLEIDTMKSSIENLHSKIKSMENDIQSKIISCESRISELFNNYASVITTNAITRDDVDRLNTEINRITGDDDENSVSNHGILISQLHLRLKSIEDNFIKKN